MKYKTKIQNSQNISKIQSEKKNKAKTEWKTILLTHIYMTSHKTV